MANTTADKLAKLAATKADLKAALAEKGQTVGDVFSTYPAAVRAISAGSGGYVPTDFFDWGEAEKGFGIVLNTYGAEVFCFPSYRMIFEGEFYVDMDVGYTIRANNMEVYVFGDSVDVRLDLIEGTIEVSEGSVEFYMKQPS